MSSNNEDLRNMVTVYIREADLMEVLQWCNRPDGHLLAVHATEYEIPEDAKILRVWVDYGRRAIGVLLEHESFDPVPWHCHTPELGAYITRVLVRHHEEEFTAENAAK